MASKTWLATALPTLLKRTWKKSGAMTRSEDHRTEKVEDMMTWTITIQSKMSQCTSVPMFHMSAALGAEAEGSQENKSKTVKTK